MTRLSLGGNAIQNVQPLSGLLALAVLTLNNNDIVDVGPLSGLVDLNQLRLEVNFISVTDPLATLTALTRLIISINPIDCDADTALSALATAGVCVHTDCFPLPPSCP